uniref:Secreted protein n=1 Tax=Opuntia streptacantha TaxID=393608 RepID=A0A7C9CVN4_OPUST
MRQGLFLVLRLSIWITRSICGSLPTTGSTFPSCANFVKFMLNSCSVCILSPELVGTLATSSFVSPIICTTFLRILSGSTSKFSRTRIATPPPSLTNPSSKCSVPI